MTIHKWSGIGDGRFTGNKLRQLLVNDEQYQTAYTRIRTTDLLIIDEISMFRKQMMDNLENVCRVKNEEKPYGGIQIVVVGDFKQLPPVRNMRYGDLGNFAFESENWPCHSIFLQEVIRQTNLSLIYCTKEFSVGSMTSDLNQYCMSLARPLGNENSTKLFANNTLVDLFNRECILKLPRVMYRFDAQDEGDVSQLKNIIVKKTLWLKIGVKVMLLRNLTNKLVNGLVGEVKQIMDETVKVFFPSVDVLADIKRVLFTCKKYILMSRRVSYYAHIIKMTTENNK